MMFLFSKDKKLMTIKALLLNQRDLFQRIKLCNNKLLKILIFKKTLFKMKKELI